MRTLFVIVSGFLWAAGSIAAQSADSLDFVTTHTDFREIRQMLGKHVRAKAFEQLDARKQEVARISSASEVAARKKTIRERVLRAIGGLPERTPLNARTTGVIERDAYRIEKIVFESQPKFYVTANLYVPKRGQPPYPAVLYPLGHETGAKANPVWQQMLGSLATKGYVALTWDTLGQGERIQLYDEDFRRSKLVQSTTEHTVQGTQCLLVGDTLAHYTIWDGIRALDYLLSRKEVDPKRIACSGNSGGGTHTTYLTALDDRIQVAAPSCYITTWRRLLETIGPQDAEQCMPPFLAAGLDIPDFIHAAAPRPFLVLSAIRDFFSITGARQAYAESKRIYEVAGAAGKIGMVEADDGHGFTKPRRMAAYDWISRWLKDTPDTAPEPEIEIASEAELFATPSGQVTTSLGGETVFTLNRARAQQLQRRDAALNADAVRAAIGFESVTGAIPVRAFGTIDRPGYTIEKLVYESEPGISIPSVLFVPKEAAGPRPAVIFVDGRGKAAAREQLEGLAASGLAVLAIDARGFGETSTRAGEGSSEWSRSFGDYDSGMTALLTGRSLVGMRALDIVRAVDLLAARDGIDSNRIYAVGVSGGAVPLLHAAFLDTRIRRVVLDGMLSSYSTVVNQRINRGVFEQVVQGVLKVYDLPDLVASIAPRPVRISDPVDAAGAPVPLAEAQAQYKRAPAESLRITQRRLEEPPLAAYRDLLVQ